MSPVGLTPPPVSRLSRLPGRPAMSPVPGQTGQTYHVMHRNLEYPGDRYTEPPPDISAATTGQTQLY